MGHPKMRIEKFILTCMKKTKWSYSKYDFMNRSFPSDILKRSMSDVPSKTPAIYDFMNSGGKP